jgi:hypothetical protein
MAATIAASTAGGAEPVSMEEVKARLGQQRQKIESLHLRVRRETRLFLDPKTLFTGPYGPALPRNWGTDEILVAFKGEKRYQRVLELDYKPAPPVGPASEAAKDMRRHLDEAKAWTGGVVLERNRDLQSGKFVYRTTAGEKARDCFPPPPYLRSVGLAVADPTGQDPSRRNVQ